MSCIRRSEFLHLRIHCVFLGWLTNDCTLRSGLRFESRRETNYKAYLCYLTCVEVCISLKSGSDRDFIVESRETLTTLADKYGSTERAPLLAHLELVRRFNLPEEEKIDLLKTYWTRFGHKAVVVEDLRQYWPVEGETESHGIMKEMLQKDLQGEEDVSVSHETCAGCRYTDHVYYLR